MKYANKKELANINFILAHSFTDNQSVNYILKRKKDKSLISKLISYSINKAELFGSIFLNENNNACCILIDPKWTKNKFTIRSLWLDLKLAITVIGIRNLVKIKNISQKNIYLKILITSTSGL